MCSSDSKAYQSIVYQMILFAQKLYGVMALCSSQQQLHYHVSVQLKRLFFPVKWNMD